MYNWGPQYLRLQVKKKQEINASAEQEVLMLIPALVWAQWYMPQFQHRGFWFEGLGALFSGCIYDVPSLLAHDPWLNQCQNKCIDLPIKQLVPHLPSFVYRYYRLLKKYWHIVWYAWRTLYVHCGIHLAKHKVICVYFIGIIQSIRPLSLSALSLYRCSD